MLLRSFFTNSVGILTSRIFGFLRDLMTASILGANIYSDIFFVAFKLPNLFRRIFAEGAFTQAFLPAFTKSHHKGVFLAKTLVKFTLFLFFLSFVVMLVAPWLTKLIAYGFDETTIALATPLVRINFWYLLLIFLVTFAASLLHYRHHFATTAFSTALLNIAMIFALWLSDPNKPEQTVYYLSYGVLGGGLLQAFVHLIALHKRRLCPLFFGGFKQINNQQKTTREPYFYKNFFHAILGTSTAQLSAFVDTWLASFLAFGSISYLYYANRIFQLPLALFAIALSVAVFPRITKQIKQKNMTQAKALLKHGFWFLSTLLGLATVGGIVLSNEIIWGLFERGSFTQTDTTAAAWVLSMYMVGLLPFGLAKLFSLWLYAGERQKEAAKIAAWSLGTNIVLSLILITPMGAAGLALASSLSGFILLALTIKAYGTQDFLAIILSFKLPALIALLTFEGFVLYYLKDLFHGYL